MNTSPIDARKPCAVQVAVSDNSLTVELVVDEDISIDGLLLGLPSRESQGSLERWLKTRRVAS